MYLEEIEKEERAGSVFMQFINDYAQVVRSEAIRDFSFMPEDRCDDPEIFLRNFSNMPEKIRKRS